jgi:hypothetical protein
MMRGRRDEVGFVKGKRDEERRKEKESGVGEEEM